MKSSSQGGKKALKSWGFPPYAVVLSLALHGLALAVLAPSVAERVRAVPPAAALHGRLSSAPRPAVRTETAAVAAHSTVPPAPIFGSGRFTSPSLRSDEPSPKVGVGMETLTVPPAPTFDAKPALPVPPTAALREESDALAPSQAGLRQYRLALAGEARRFRRHPEAPPGLSGTAEVRVTVDAGGANRQAELSRSSGHAALDAAALDMLRQAALHAAPPPSLRGRNFAVLLPVVFEAEE